MEKGELHLVSVCLGKEDLTCLPNWHDSHSNACNLPRLGTIWFNFDKFGWPKWSRISLGDGVAKQDRGISF